MTATGATGRCSTPSSISAHSSGAGGSSRVKMACRARRAATRLSISSSAVFGLVASTARAYSGVCSSPGTRLCSNTYSAVASVS